MEQVLTLVVKLQPDDQQKELLVNTAVAFASACTWINLNVNSNLTNRNSIQAVCYKDVKEQFGLTANHVVRACARVGANRLTAKYKKSKIKAFKPTSFDCDARTFRFMEDGYKVSVSTTGKRITIPLRVSNYHIGKLKGQNPTSAQICQHKDGCWYAHIQLKSIAPNPIKNNNVIGEDLTGIRECTNEKPRSKTERRRSNSWAFYQLRTFLEYKGIKEGIEVIAIPAAYTSQTCHCCLHIGLRSNKNFKCSNKACGWIGDADRNGAEMIRLWGCCVNQPGGSQILTCAISEGLLKAPHTAPATYVGHLQATAISRGL